MCEARVFFKSVRNLLAESLINRENDKWIGRRAFYYTWKLHDWPIKSKIQTYDQYSNLHQQSKFFISLFDAQTAPNISKNYGQILRKVQFCSFK
jgi:predicted transcriptional regulator